MVRTNALPFMTTAWGESRAISYEEGQVAVNG
jgi:hypothetical protein